MSTRAAAASSSRRAKKELVRLLFGPTYAGKGPDAHRKLDSASYSYSDLRKAYLERIHSIHPDKFAHHGTKKESDALEQNIKGDLHSRFVALQDAWDCYEKVAKMINVAKDGKQEANFTMFGVGCSFSDSPEERALRSEITDQACRGWFSSGEIAHSSADTTAAAKVHAKGVITETTVSLVDDDLFMYTEDRSSMQIHNDRNSLTGHEGRRPSLVTFPKGYKFRSRP